MPELFDDQEVLAVYTAETSELLLSLALILRELKRDPEGADQYYERLDQIIHTIKGSSAVVGVESVGSLMGEVERYFRSVRREGRHLEPPALHLLLDLTLELSTYLEETFPAPFNGEDWQARFQALMAPASEARPAPAEKIEATSAGEAVHGAQPAPGVRSDLLPPFLATVGELTALQEKMLNLYRQGTNALGDWEQLGLYLSTATEINSKLRRQALQLTSVPVSWLISRIAAECGLAGVVADGAEPEAELPEATAVKLVPPLVALIKGLGWTQVDQAETMESPGLFQVTPERAGEILTLTVRRGHQSHLGAGGEGLLVREELETIEKAIGEVQGRLEVDPAGGWFRLALPVFPAMVRCILFRVGAEEYALPAQNYLYHLTINGQEVRRSGELTFLLRYPEVIPLVVTADFAVPEEGDLTLAIIEEERVRFGLPVTRVEGYEDLLRTDPDRPVVKGALSFAKAFRPDGTMVLLAEASELVGLIPKC